MYYIIFLYYILSKSDIYITNSLFELLDLIFLKLFTTTHCEIYIEDKIKVTLK